MKKNDVLSEIKVCFGFN